jgi:hypothetical protein
MNPLSHAFPGPPGTRGDRCPRVPRREDLDPRRKLRTRAHGADPRRSNLRFTAAAPPSQNSDRSTAPLEAFSTIAA